MHFKSFFSSSLPNEDPLYSLFVSYFQLLQHQPIFHLGLSKRHEHFDFLMDEIDQSSSTTT